MEVQSIYFIIFFEILVNIARLWIVDAKLKKKL